MMVASLHLPVGGPRVGQGVPPADVDPQLAGLDQVEDAGRACSQLLGAAGVVDQASPGQVDRARLDEPGDVKRRDGAAGLAVDRQHAAWCEAGQVGLEGRASNAVVDRGHAGAGSELGHLGGEIGLGVADHLVGSVVPSELFLLSGRYGADHPAATQLGHLGQQLADSARARVHQHRVAGLHRVGRLRQVVRGHALDEHGGGGFRWMAHRATPRRRGRRA
jgi:hypothetical protein